MKLSGETQALGSVSIPLTIDPPVGRSTPSDSLGHKCEMDEEDHSDSQFLMGRWN